MERESAPRATRFSDVCGTLDELKRMVCEEEHPDPGVMGALLDDVRYMMGRMDRRLGEYLEFAQKAEALAAQVLALGSSGWEQAAPIVDEMDALARGGVSTAAGVETLCVQAERVRDVANGQEQKLRRAKEAAISLYRLYLSVRGERDWGREEAGAPSAPATNLIARLDPWLPPPPHRERILDFLQRGRAHLVGNAAEGQPPLVEFEDGGVMPLPRVRWSEEVSNFYPEGETPHPRGRRYRP
ncbi:MAG: hypothetical protein QHJ73_08960 [Armatimonadota bacterium]|nr:hypothetical protein [Armatimonadota bacterium]